MNTPRQDHDATVGPSLEDLLRLAVAVGAVLIVLLPAARGFSDTFGWMPLWLLAMPLSAWWALHRFRLPAREADDAGMQRTRRRSGEQARRRRPATLRRRQSQAA